MKWKSEKIVAYVLLGLGVSVMLFSIYQMLIVFSGSSSPPKLFNFQDISISVPSIGVNTSIPGSVFNNFGAMVFWVILNVFIMWGGGRIASLGIKLRREIGVEIKEPSTKIEEKETGKTEEKKES